jgi:hypothetical protein
MKNPVRDLRLLSGEDAENLSVFLDDVHYALERKVKTYLTWTPDIRFGWKLRQSSRFVGCYVRWHEDHSPGGRALTVFFCSEGVETFAVVQGLAELESSFWERYAGCRHYMVVNSESQAKVAARAVVRLFELTSLNKRAAAIS